MANYGGTEVMRVVVMYIGLKEQPVYNSYLKGSLMINMHLFYSLAWIDLILGAKQKENQSNSQKTILNGNGNAME